MFRVILGRDQFSVVLNFPSLEVSMVSAVVNPVSTAIIQSWLVVQVPSYPACIFGGPQPGQFSLHIKLVSGVERSLPDFC